MSPLQFLRTQCTRRLAMLAERMAARARVPALIILAAGLGACRKEPLPEAGEPTAPALGSEAAGKAKLTGPEATKRAVEFARSASAAAKNAAAAAERAAAAADAAVEAIRKIPQAPPATPKPEK